MGLTTSFLILWSLGRWLLPAVFGALPDWLPEDFLMGAGLQILADLMQWMPALAFSALVLTFSYWLKPAELPQGEVQALIRSSFLAIGATVVFALLGLLAQPWADSRLEEFRFRYEQTKQLEDSYLAIKGQGSSNQTAAGLEARFALLRRLGVLRPLQSQGSGHERLDYEFELQLLKAHFDLDEFFKLRALPGVEETGDTANATVEELLLKAEEALADGGGDREYLANLWGFQVYRRLMNFTDQGQSVDPKVLERAKTLVDQSWARIYEKTLAADERLKASYFFRKGKSLGDFQFQNYLEAYYGFQELHLENPRDSEVTRHWELSRERIKEQVLFYQEMEVLFTIPGSQDLVFLNREAPPEVVRIGKLLHTNEGVFVKDLEFLRFDAQGRPLLHWTAPYGRWTAAGIDFRVWDKDSPRPRFPIVLTESPGQEFNTEAVDPPLFVPRMSVQDLELVNTRQLRPQGLGTWDLLVHGRSIEALGFNSRLFQTEFVVRLAAPFGFFVVFLFVMALAWFNRAHETGKTWWFLIPVLPLVSDFLVQSFAWASRLAVGGLLGFVGLETTSIILAVLFVVGSALGLTLVQLAFRKSLKSL